MGSHPLNAPDQLNGESAIVKASARVLAPALLAALLCAPSALAEDTFFRYENAEGVTVIDDHVPPQFAHKGYQVLNAAGRVVEVIPRALTESERKQTNNSVIQAQLRREEQERQARYDDMLLARYSTIEDIEAARKRRLDEIKVRINLLKGNIANQKQQLEARQEEAATLERGGQPVPKDLTGTIESLRAEIGVADQQIVRFRSELAATDLRFNMDVERFHILRPNIPRP